MPQRLEGAERPAELDARLQVLDGRLEAPLRRSHALRRERGVQEVDRVVDGVRTGDR